MTNRNKIYKYLYILLSNNSITSYNAARKTKVKFPKIKLTTAKLHLVIASFRSKYIVDRKRKYSKSELRLLYTWYKNIRNVDLIIKYFNKKYNHDITKRSLALLMSRHRIKKGKRNAKKFIISADDEYKIIKLYKSGLRASQIANIFGFKTRKSIYDILISHNIPRREHSEYTSYKDFVLNKIDSQFKAYYVGLMITDGYVTKEESGRVFFGIQLVDLDCIQYLSKNINVTYTTIKANSEKHQTMYRVVIYGKRFIEPFARFGVEKNKSLTCKGPKLFDCEMKFIPQILRGMIDGDGWIRKDGKEFFFCSASIDLANWVKNSLEFIGMKCLKVSFKDNGYNGMYYVRTALKSNIKILKNIIYDGDFGMHRKYARLYQ